MGAGGAAQPPAGSSRAAELGWAVCGVNSSVGVWDNSRRSLVFATEPAHSETIFDCRHERLRAVDERANESPCRLKPSQQHTLATASYDGSVKVHGQPHAALRDGSL
jgi:hypothetical protein